MSVPTNIISLTTSMILKVQPVTHACLRQWKHKAQNIPDPELRKQAMASIATKTFHCEGGSLYGLLAGHQYRNAVSFIVAYQTISDYLDNLCDRSTSQDPDDFRALHESMLQALMPDAPLTSYYRFRREQNDGGYLTELVETCRTILGGLPNYPLGKTATRELAGLYIDLQVHKHVRHEERIPRLKAWYEKNREILPPMSWYEFAACAGSTLGIFCIVSYLFQPSATSAMVKQIQQAYFPWVQGLHILLDYLIDQEEDRKGRDLNFCSYYDSPSQLTSRLKHFYKEAQTAVGTLPDATFHHLINRGLLSIYLADRKVSHQKDVRSVAKALLRLGGGKAFFFYLHCWVYRRLI